MGEIAGRGRIIETLQIVWRTEDWRNTGSTIGTVAKKAMIYYDWSR